MKKLFTLTFAILLIASVATLSSCRKKEDTVAKVTVLREGTGAPIGGATVRLYGEVSDTIYDPENIVMDVEATTDASGVATFNFNDYYKLGQAGFTVLTIDIIENGGATHESVGVIKIEEEQVNETTVEVP